MTSKKFDIYIALLLRFIIALLLFTFCRIIFLVFNFSFYSDISSTAVFKILTGGVIFDISSLFYLLSLYIVFQILPFKFRNIKLYQKISFWLYLIPVSLGIILNLSDTLYYQFTLKRTTFAIIEQFSNETNMGKLFFQFILDYWYMVLTSGSLIYLTIFLNKKIDIKTVKIKNPFYYFISSLAFSCLVAALFIIGVRGGYKHSTRPITLSNASKFTTKPNQRAIVLNTPFALIKTFNEDPLKEVQYFSSLQKQEEVYSAYHHNLKIGNNSFQKKNVVLIILESFGREHIGALNKHIPNYKGFTPFLDSLINSSYTFKKSFANGRKSISGMPSTIASIPSLTTPFVLSHYSGNDINSLANILGKEGYYSAFFHGAPNGSMGFDAFSRQAGFTDYFGMSEYGNDDDFDGFWGIWDEDFFQFYANEMNGMKEPFFTSIFSLSSHHPFQLPEKYKNVFPKGELPIQETIGYSDNALKEFFKTSSKMPWFKNTIFVLTADHAATFSDLDEYKTPAGAFAVPIIIYDPSNPKLAGINDSNVIQHIDIMPTVLNMLNYPDEYIAFGTDVFDSLSDHFALTNYSGTYHLFKGDYLLQYDGINVVGLYNFIEDPLFVSNLINDKKPQQEELLKLCQAFIQEHNRRMIHNKTTIKNN